MQDIDTAIERVAIRNFKDEAESMGLDPSGFYDLEEYDQQQYRDKAEIELKR